MAKFKNESKLVSEQNVLALIDKLRANDELPASTAILLKNQIQGLPDNSICPVGEGFLRIYCDKEECGVLYESVNHNEADLFCASLDIINEGGKECDIHCFVYQNPFRILPSDQYLINSADFEASFKK